MQFLLLISDIIGSLTSNDEKWDELEITQLIPVIILPYLSTIHGQLYFGILFANRSFLCVQGSAFIASIIFAITILL